eukprot:CAMPEP_0174731252 /NCGR_PEP_ID=MMETSP1094-20130205/57168_1 /TAXON_ID=156173 /ORGANISM="Chrysochromulina brevifilum, Strain UTEX LB 985" /LENGTH=184 /DNA_ID=CAMNT_0015933613 /DNA_START=311 /DNA_END=866 /DNA_ORIENTATION=+
MKPEVASLSHALCPTSSSTDAPCTRSMHTHASCAAWHMHHTALHINHHTSPISTMPCAHGLSVTDRAAPLAVRRDATLHAARCATRDANRHTDRHRRRWLALLFVVGALQDIELPQMAAPLLAIVEDHDRCAVARELEDGASVPAVVAALGVRVLRLHSTTHRQELPVSPYGWLRRGEGRSDDV